MFENAFTNMFEGHWLCISYLDREILMSAVMKIKNGRIRRFKWICPEFTKHFLDQNPIYTIYLDEMLDYEDEEHPIQNMNDIYFNVKSIKEFIRKEKSFLKARKKQRPPEKPQQDRH